MQNKRMIFGGLVVGLFSLGFFVNVRIAEAEVNTDRLRLDSYSSPILDGERQKTFKVDGFASYTGVSWDTVRIDARWAHSGRTDSSPVWTKFNGGFSHVFPVGDAQRCGLVVFEAHGTVRGLKYESNSEWAWVDCQAPRVLIGKPVEGQMVKAGSNVELELRIEDDLLAAKRWSFGLGGYDLKIDLDGQPVFSGKLNVASPVLQKWNVLVKEPGRRGIRVKIQDKVMKSDEKTVWINVDGTAPQVRVISPTGGQAVTIPSGAMPVVTVEVEATDPGEISSGIDKVEFYLNGQGVAAARTPSEDNKYVGRFGVSRQGAHAIRVKALDKVGNAAEITVNINVVFAGSTAPAGKPPKPSRTLPR
ncbi:MAG: hypothetical protein FJZ10_04305 [Candidatus Omnitrophica bacterium]|nr:hypothetical protein [Candidatus Omnitrophota bacterium]